MMHRLPALMCAPILMAACSSTPNQRPSGFDSYFDGERFHNVAEIEDIGLWDILQWRLDRDRGPWDDAASDFEAGDPPPERTAPGAARVTFISHATVLIQLDGANILTDPVYAQSVGPFGLVATQRVRPPGIRFDDLPKIDAVLISHNHFDHLCTETLQRVHARDRPVMLVGLEGAPLLREHGVDRVRELDWWEAHELTPDLAVTFVPAQHFSNRGLTDEDETLWGGFVVTGRRHRIFFAGDTGRGPHFDAIRERLGAPDLAILPVGAFRPLAIMRPVHLTPADAVEAHLQLGARASMAMHYGTFPVADDGQHEPLELLTEALSQQRVEPEHFWTLEFGEGRTLP